jgi:hypothetical protein
MLVMALNPANIDANKNLTLKPYTGVSAGALKLVAGRVGGIEFAITNTPLGVPEVVARQMPLKVARELAQWVDSTVALVSLNGTVLTSVQVLQLAYKNTEVTAL